MTRRLLVLLAVLALTACGEDPAAVATASPSPDAVPAGPNILPAPAGTASVPADTGPAGQALAAAARKTSDSGSFRVHLQATFNGIGSNPSGVMTGSGETESHTRFHLLLAFTFGPQQLTTESVAFDGVNYGRTSTKPWRVVSATGSGADPRSYIGYLSGATEVRDAGPGTRDGQPAERFEALVDLSRKGAASPAAAASGPAAALGNLVAWVDAASGRLVGLDLSSAAMTAAPTRLAISFVDFGAAIKVVPPIPAP